MGLQVEQDPRLEKALERFIRELMQRNHDIKEADIKDLVKITMDIINTKEDVLGLHQMQDPQFIKRLTLTVLTVNAYKETPKLQDELKKALGIILPIAEKNDPAKLKLEPRKAAFLDEFIKMLEKTEQKDMPAEFQKLLDKFLTPAEQLALTGGINGFVDKLFKEVEQKNPGVLERVDVKPEDLNITLLNLLSPNQTGSIPVPVMSYSGNQQGVVDQSSQHNTDNMAWVDKPIEAAGETIGLEVQKSELNVELSNEVAQLFHQSLKAAGFQVAPTNTIG